MKSIYEQGSEGRTMTLDIRGSPKNTRKSKNALVADRGFV